MLTGGPIGGSALAGLAAETVTLPFRRRAPSGQIPAKTSDDWAHQPAAAA